MLEIPDHLIEMPVASRVLGISVKQSLSLCSLLGIQPVRRSDEFYLERDALQTLYRRLYPDLVGAA